jgi:hypothetical protein
MMGIVYGRYHKWGYISWDTIGVTVYNGDECRSKRIHHEKKVIDAGFTMKKW